MTDLLTVGLGPCPFDQIDRFILFYCCKLSDCRMLIFWWAGLNKENLKFDRCEVDLVCGCLNNEYYLPGTENSMFMKGMPLEMHILIVLLLFIISL